MDDKEFKAEQKVYEFFKLRYKKWGLFEYPNFRDLDYDCKLFWRFIVGIAFSAHLQHLKNLVSLHNTTNSENSSVKPWTLSDFVK
jgi:hypothetical protein